MAEITPPTKQHLRRQARAARKKLSDRRARNQQIADRLHTLPEYQTADTLMFYISVHEEVATNDLIAAAFDANKNVVIPYCSAGELQLFRLQDFKELTPGSYGIPEPTSALRQQSDRIITTNQLDVIFVPGVAFDVHGARCGHGKGYYDKLLQTTKGTIPMIALAYDCQLFPKIATESHDVYMDKIITESTIYPGT